MRHNPPVIQGLPIRLVAKKTGLTAHTIRAWEKRYSVLSPERSTTNRRLYSDEDVERLRLLKQATDAGHSISQIAGLCEEELALLAPELPNPAHGEDQGKDLFHACVAHIVRLDAQGLESALVRAQTLLGIDGLIQRITIPILEELHNGWQEGRIGVAHEHMTTAIVRSQLAQCLRPLSPNPLSPRLLVTTPSGQHHEIGAMLAAVAAARNGWHVTYLGPNTPAADIVTAADQLGVKTLALSIVYPDCDPELELQLQELRRGLGPQRRLIVGGRAAASCSKVLDEIGAHRVEDLASLLAALAE